MADKIRTEIHPIRQRWTKARLQAEIEHLRRESRSEIDDLRKRLRVAEARVRQLQRNNDVTHGVELFGRTAGTDPMWDREQVQRVLYHVVARYQAATAECGLLDEFLHSAIVDVAIPTLKDNNWWPAGDRKEPQP